MKKSFVSVGRLQCHLRAGGRGPAIVLFHAAPFSSAQLLPLMQQLKNRFTLIAPDTPGYGLSDSLPQSAERIEDYIPYFRQLFDQLNLSKFAIYGTAAGAQMALRYALEYPDQVSHLYLDNAGHFDDKQRADLLDNYFPDLNPTIGGSHLQSLWQIVKGHCQYFPWYAQQAAHKLSTPMPSAEVLHQRAIDYLQAGPDYARAYRLAFLHERAEHVQQLKVPTTIFNWADSPVRPYIQQLLNHDLPPHVQICNTPAEETKRYKKMGEHIRQSSSSTLRYTLQLPTKYPARGQRYCKSPVGQLHALYDFWKKEEPLLILHAQGGSAALMKQNIQQWSQPRAVIAISKPGHGDSDPIAKGKKVGDMNQLIKNAMKSLGFEEHGFFSMPPSTPPYPLKPDAEGRYLLEAWMSLRSILASGGKEQLHIHLLEWMKAREWS
ncbi:MAG: alpha/beta hydrolase [Bacteroidota bacterium]